MRSSVDWGAKSTGKNQRGLRDLGDLSGERLLATR